MATVVSRYDARADIGQEDIERVVGLPVWGVLPSDYRKVLAAANAGSRCVGQPQPAGGVGRQLAQRLTGAESAEAQPVRAAPAKLATRLTGLF